MGGTCVLYDLLLLFRQTDHHDDNQVLRSPFPMDRTSFSFMTSWGDGDRYGAKLAERASRAAHRVKPVSRQNYCTPRSKETQVKVPCRRSK